MITNKKLVKIIFMLILFSMDLYFSKCVPDSRLIISKIKDFQNAVNSSKSFVVW